ncbi:MAG: type II RES/Xre toxin-antitoxin system antitoxin [Gemmatimonadaceae bacterium]
MAEATMGVEAVALKLGGVKVLHRQITSELDLAEAVREGLPSESLDFVVEAVRGWVGSRDAVLDIVGSSRTLQRKTGGRKASLKPAESDRLARLTRLIVRAEQAIGNPEKAQRWLMKPNRVLGGEVPFTLLDSDAGASAVEQVLGRIEYGVYS